MSGLDDMMAGFQKDLEARRARHEAQVEREATDLREVILREIQLPPMPDLSRRVTDLGQNWQKPTVSAPIHSQVDMSGLGKLRELDEAFNGFFKLQSYFSTNRLAYPTKYCETLEEFFRPMVESSDYSEQAREQELAEMVADAIETAKKHGGGTMGYNMPGKGAYVNGWLLAYRSGLTPRQALDNPQLLNDIYETAIHEKLGHGFLFAYSALGAVKTRLGLERIELAQRFGRREVDDPLYSLRMQQHGLIFNTSQFLEEGWSTWLETFMGAGILKSCSHPRHDVNKIVQAIKSLPSDQPNRQEVIETLLTAMVILFGEEDQDPGVVLKAILVMESCGGSFGSQLKQPLRYALGEMLFLQAEANLGAVCVPYAALIAGNVTFDPASMGITDLKMLLNSHPRLNPDARMALISRCGLAEKNNVPLMAEKIASLLSISAPAELK